MRRVFVAAACGAIALGIASACGDFEEDAAPAPKDAGTTTDAVTGENDSGTDAGTASEPDGGLDGGAPSLDSGLCDHTLPFIGFQSLGTVVNTGAIESHPRLTPDELNLYVTRGTAVMRFQRASRKDEWGPGKQVQGGSIASHWPAVQGRRYYYDVAAGIPPTWRIYRTELDDAGTPTSTLVPGLAAVGVSNLEPYFSPDESEVWFASNRTGAQYDLFHATAMDGGGFEGIEPLNVNTNSAERGPVVSADGRAIFFATESGRKAGKGVGTRMAIRAANMGPFEPLTKVPGLGDLEDEDKDFEAAPGWISPDNCRLYLTTTYDSTPDIYVAWRR